jgi:hypothetical protein
MVVRVNGPTLKRIACDRRSDPHTLSSRRRIIEGDGISTVVLARARDPVVLRLSTKLLPTGRLARNVLIGPLSEISGVEPMSVSRPDRKRDPTRHVNEGGNGIPMWIGCPSLPIAVSPEQRSSLTAGVGSTGVGYERGGVARRHTSRLAEATLLCWSLLRVRGDEVVRTPLVRCVAATEATGQAAICRIGKEDPWKSWSCCSQDAPKPVRAMRLRSAREESVLRGSAIVLTSQCAGRSPLPTSRSPSASGAGSRA